MGKEVQTRAQELMDSLKVKLERARVYSDSRVGVYAKMILNMETVFNLFNVGSIGESELATYLQSFEAELKQINN